MRQSLRGEKRLFIGGDSEYAGFVRARLFFSDKVFFLPGKQNCGSGSLEVRCWLAIREMC